MAERDQDRLAAAERVRRELAIENQLSRAQARAYVRCLQATWQVQTIQWDEQDSQRQLADARRLLHAAHIFRSIEGPGFHLHMEHFGSLGTESRPRGPSLGRGPGFAHQDHFRRPVRHSQAPHQPGELLLCGTVVNAIVREFSVRLNRLLGAADDRGRSKRILGNENVSCPGLGLVDRILVTKICVIQDTHLNITTV